MQLLKFFTATAKNKRISTLQPNNHFTGTGMINQHLINFILGVDMFDSTFFSDIDPFCRSG